VPTSRSFLTASFCVVFDKMSSTDYFYPFDGKCARSKDADFTLTFDDKSSLKFSKLLLELTSPVIKTQIEYSQHDGILHLSKTSHDMWVLILNYIHPAGKSVACVESIIKSGWESLVSLLKATKQECFLYVDFGTG